MTTRDDVQRLQADLDQAMQRMAAVGNGLARLRADLDRVPPAPAGIPVGPTHPGGTAPQGGAVPPGAAVGGTAVGGPPAAWSSTPPRPAPATGPRWVATQPPPPPAGPVRPREPWYRREGAVTRVLAVSGAVLTLAGVTMLLVLAVRQGWFGPAARVTAGALLATALGVLGTRGGARDRGRGARVGSAPVALVATGAAVAYLDVVAVTVLYAWVPPVVGLVLCGAVAAVGLRLARTWSSGLLATMTVAGAGAFSPVVAGEPGWLLSAVLAVLAAAGWWAGRGVRSPALTIVRTTPVTLSLLVTAGTVATSVEAALILLVAALTAAGTVLAASSAVRHASQDVAASVATGLACTALVVVAAVQPDGLDTLALATTAAVLLLVATSLARPPAGPLPRHLVATIATGGSLSMVTAVLDGAPVRFVGTGLLVLALGHAAVAGATRSRLSLALSAAVGTLAVAAWLPQLAATTSERLAVRADLGPAFVDSVLLVFLAGVGIWALTQVRRVPGPVRTLARPLGLALALAGGTSAVVTVGTMGGLRAGDPTLGFVAGHTVATLGWMLTAAALLLSFERRQEPETALRLGLAVAALAVAKLFLFDLAALDGVLRSLAFTGTGLLLLATGSRYARAWERLRAAGLGTGPSDRTA